MISTFITRASAGLLALVGVVLLFASDDVLPLLVRGFPRGAYWLGQLVAAGWLGIAALNWVSQRALLGGIYGRSVVLANAAFYFIAASVLLRVVARPGAPMVLRVVAVPILIFAGVYGWLLFRGPFERDFQMQARS